MTELTGSKIVFRYTSFGNLFAGSFMTAISLLALWQIHEGRSQPRDTLGLTIVSLIFLGIGLMGAWDTSRTRVAVGPNGLVDIIRIRFITNHAFFQKEVQQTDIGYIQYARSFTRGGGIWLVLKDGTRLQLARISRVPLPFALWPSRRIRAKAQKLSQSLGVSLMA